MTTSSTPPYLQPDVPTLADYADALLTAKRARSAIVGMLLTLLLVELAIFFLAKYKVFVLPEADSTGQSWRGLLQYLVGLIDFLGLILPGLLIATLLVTLMIMVVARLRGAGRTVSATIFAVLLAVLLFPWQAFLNNPVMAGPQGTDAMGIRIPGVLYTWAELKHPTLGAHFSSDDHAMAILRWARFVAFPVLALLIAIVVQVKSDRGVRAALGQDEHAMSADLPTTESTLESERT